MDNDELVSSASYQGQELDTEKSEESGQPVYKTENSATDEAATERQAPRESEKVQRQDQAEVTPKAIDYEKSYKELERKYTKDSQERAQYQRELQTERQQRQSERQALEAYRQVDAILEKNPQAVEQLRALISGKQISPEVANNPLYQELQPVMRDVQELKQFVQQAQATQVRTQAEGLLDQQINAAKESFKSAFGQDLSRDDEVAVLNWMNDNKNYNGKTAIRDLYWDKYGETKSQAVLQNQSVKKNLGTTKVASNNSNVAKAKSDGILSYRQAWKEARKELGIDN